MSTSRPMIDSQLSCVHPNQYCAGGATHCPNLSDELTCAEFFAGIGLMRMGLQKQGWRVVFANDFDPKKRRMYEDHFGPAPYLTDCDIRSLDACLVPRVTLATASFPCTDLSLAGSREGLDGKQSSAFWAFLSVLGNMEHRPPIVFIENVPGFLTSHGGKDIRAALLAINRLGYVIDIIIVDAIHFVPQSRARLFIIAHLLTAITTSAISESAVRPHPVIEVIEANPDVRWCIRELPSLPLRNICLEDILEQIQDDDPIWWSETRQQYLLDQMSKRHRVIANKMINSKNVGYGTIFRRMRAGVSTAELRTDGIAGCLRTPTGGSARQILFVAGNGDCRVRLITPREAARLMGADAYTINVCKTNALFGFGDAVCVDVVDWIAANYINPLARELTCSAGPESRNSLSSCS